MARGCKPRLSASSSTGAQKSKLDAEAGSPVKSSPATAWFFRPTSAALLPSSLMFLLSSNAPLRVCSENANNCIKRRTLRFCEVHGILNKGVRNSSNWHTLNSIRQAYCFLAMHPLGEWSYHYHSSDSMRGEFVASAL
jgi:hypothetical protein